MADRPIPAAERGFTRALEALGVPSPPRNCVVQARMVARSDGSGSDAVIRCRYTGLKKFLPQTALTPTTEHRGEHAMLWDNSRIVRWVTTMAYDSIVLIYKEFERRGIPWPGEWPRFPNVQFASHVGNFRKIEDETPADVS